VNNIFEKYDLKNCFINKISLLAMENVGKETLLKNYFQDLALNPITMISHGLAFVTKDLELYGKGIRNHI